ncbi:MAG: IPTL-CTERM sorting domain-containing protein [Brevundimonas sp.]|uniref:IPTL-CTERM sorting domain-containing protein n=1 Tax=Brevundimonas sp. TaxID=1871086 RepID=UPI0025C506A5|nr:IPTL-CTERM sorting domain-containing protein [Brevundimonas sp.]MBX3476381.1 IPTL-CTERM sorting domain-containing protein [Brevundimonas sp.]
MRFLVGGAMALGLLSAAGSVSAQVTYNFQGGLYNSIINGGACVVGECATFTAADRANASITFAAPLAPNLTNVDVSAQITAYSFSNGVTSTVGPGPNAAIYQALVTTDAGGTLTNYSILLERTPGPPYPVGDPADANSRWSYVAFTPSSGNAYANAVCLARFAPAAVSGPGACGNIFIDAGTSIGGASTPTTFSLVTPTPTVPTLSEWAMILFALLLAGGAAVVIQQRRTA